MGHALIAGCGDVGSRVGEMLAEIGFEVLGLRRSKPKASPNGIQLVQADVTDAKKLAAALPEDCDLVFYCVSADEDSEAAYDKAYVQGPKNLIQALAKKKLRPRRMVFASSTGVYGQTSGEWVDESSPTEPRSFRGTKLLEGEKAFLESGFPVVVARLGGIYGPGRGSLVKRIQDGKGIFFDDPPVYSNRIHTVDAALALTHLAELGSVKPIYLVVDDEPASRAAVHRWIAKRLELDFTSEAKRTPPIHGNKRCRNTLLKNTGYHFRYPTYRDGYAELVHPETPTD